MQLAYIGVGELTLSPFDVRDGKRAPDISDVVPSIRRRSILQSLLVPKTAVQTLSTSSPDGGVTTPQRQIADERKPGRPARHHEPATMWPLSHPR
ncbi:MULTISPECIES: hypothetical protein [Mesorhizobium]|uniref:hypothetical protein n=1 Tax=Mesorhizobium TaxID=68287 RepID=UPI0007ED519C|nr:MULTISPECIES: hypothetical protein [Mesorhizobium]TPJ40389.1 hypothetical protein FJ437_26075 [Mesorhizobium sp. B2-6-6]ARP67234.1 hypothetical protein A9K65_030780 [Mesorhizobium sp. WSM1497]MCA0002818.1 hypothetical protein [Mesorhizobium sp. B264B2A]MCA0009031.1 hypothetical protein [Mesorhizobium sp. B264B1B]MCA0014571.1 hypothetical protein [Mesorhizobium sp. B294B1A1]